MKSQFRIEALDCPVEEQLIRKRFSKVSEVESLTFDLMNRQLTVEHRFATEEPLRQALEEIGLGASAECECCHEPHRMGFKDVRLGVGVLLATAAEVIAIATQNERTIPVAVLSIAAILFGGLDAFRKGLVALKTLTLNINFLMSIAVIGAFAIGSFPEAAMVAVLFAIAERVESFALERARNAVRGLMELAPDTATVHRGGDWVEAMVSSIVEGEIVRVKPGERIALDGVVIAGHSAVNQAPITGESIPVDKCEGSELFAGTVNEEGVLEFRVTSTRGHTTLDRIIHTVQEAQGSRAQTQRFIDAFAKVYTPAIVVVAILIAGIPPLLGHPFVPWLYKALVLLVIACPCALVISTPVTVVSGLAAAARRGILIKGGVHLESGRHLTTIALDKTGTLTHGRPVVVSDEALHGFDLDRARQIAASLDQLSSHPVARAIEARWSGGLLPVDRFESIHGRGVRGVIDGETYLLGNHRMMQEAEACCDHLHSSLEAVAERGMSIVILASTNQALAVFAVADELREESVEAVQELHRLGLKVVMLTGDNAATANAIARKAGIDTVHSEMLPEAKLEVVRSLTGAGQHVGMVGDGMNDAPALALARVGFAMGAAGTDTAIETADVALMDDDLRKIPAYIVLSRRASSILAQNIVLSLGIKAVFFGMALAGTATLWMAVFADMGASLLVVGNGLRVMKR